MIRELRTKTNPPASALPNPLPKRQKRLVASFEILAKYLILLAPRAGFEPATIRLTVECSTAELPRNRRNRRSRAAYNKASSACKGPNAEVFHRIRSAIGRQFERPGRGLAREIPAPGMTVTAPFPHGPLGWLGGIIRQLAQYRLAATHVLSRRDGDREQDRGTAGCDRPDVIPERPVLQVARPQRCG
jgi:hypothetical protein